IQQVGPLVEAGDYVDSFDDAWVCPTERHHRLDSLELLRVGGDSREEMSLDRRNRIEPWLGEHEFVELVSCRTHRDERRPNFAASGRVDGVDAGLRRGSASASIDYAMW